MLVGLRLIHTLEGARAKSEVSVDVRAIKE